MNNRASFSCYDATGNLITDISYNTTKIIGSFETGTENGSRFIELDDNTLSIWYFIEKFNIDEIPTDVRTMFVFPQTSLDGQTIFWEFHNAIVDGKVHVYLGLQEKKVSAKIIYGVYYELNKNNK